MDGCGGGTDEAQSIDTIYAAIDKGIGLIDTAPVYGFGRSEEIVGKALAGGRREKVALATKVALNWSDDHSKVWRDATAARALLTGKMQKDTEFTGDDLRKNDPKFQGERYHQYLNAVTELNEFAKERYQKNVLALALRWLVDQPGVTTALWGARRPEQLDPVSEIEGWSLDREAFDAIDEILTRCITDPVGPEFMAPPARMVGPGSFELPTSAMSKRRLELSEPH